MAAIVERAREIEILRAAGSLKPSESVNVAEEARLAVLRWAQKRRGTRLPEDAWLSKSFDYLGGGRTCVGVRLETPGTDIWALRADDPDKTVPDRVWTTEVVVGQLGDETPRVSTRLFVTTRATNLEIDVAVPGFIRQFANGIGLLCGPYECLDRAWWVNDETEVEALLDSLLNNQRALPTVVVTTGSAGMNERLLPFDPNQLAIDTIGIAHIAVVPEHLTWSLSGSLGRQLSVFDGGVRVYMPAFSSDDDPFGPHILLLARDLTTPLATKRAMLRLKEQLAIDSVKRIGLGGRAISYQDVRSAAIQLRQQSLETSGASDQDKLAVANARIDVLEQRRNSDAEWQATLEADNAEQTEKARNMEALANASKQRIIQLTEILKEKGSNGDSLEPPPEDWSGFADWCDRSFPGRLILSSRARREIKNAEFEGVDIAARALIWLAGDYRTARIEGGDGTMRDFVIEAGVWNSPCGTDEYEVVWKNKKRAVDWHIKNGGNTRDPKRCLRAYYFWDAETDQVIVDHVPSHRDTSAS